jgi:glycosyltransferase involved in cell wall biosynthesis
VGSPDLVHEDLATPGWIAATRRHERWVIERAALVIANTPTLRDALAVRHPKSSDNIITVMNGIDDDPVPAGTAGPTFTIGYAGTIYYGRDPRPLFHGAARVVTDLGLTPDEFQIRFIGDASHYGGVPLENLARDAGIESHVVVGGRVSRSEAHRFLASCHMLVSLPWEDGLTVPAKLFEYMQFPAWLLVFADAGSAMDMMLRDHAVDLVGNADADGVAAAIRRRYLYPVATKFREKLRQNSENPQDCVDSAYGRPMERSARPVSTASDLSSPVSIVGSRRHARERATSDRA